MTQGAPSKVDSQVGEDMLRIPRIPMPARCGFFRGLWSGGVHFLVVKNHLPQFFLVSGGLGRWEEGSGWRMIFLLLVFLFQNKMQEIQVRSTCVWICLEEKGNTRTVSIFLQLSK